MKPWSDMLETFTLQTQKNLPFSPWNGNTVITAHSLRFLTTICIITLIRFSRILNHCMTVNHTMKTDIVFIFQRYIPCLVLSLVWHRTKEIWQSLRLLILYAISETTFYCQQNSFLSRYNRRYGTILPVYYQIPIL